MSREQAIDLLHIAIDRCLAGVVSNAHISYLDNESTRLIWRIAKSKYCNKTVVFNRVCKTIGGYDESLSGDVCVHIDRLDIIDSFIVPEFIKALESVGCLDQELTTIYH